MITFTFISMLKHEIMKEYLEYLPIETILKEFINK